MSNPYGQDPYQQYPQYGAYPQGYPGMPMPPRNNGLAIASMCVSLGALITCYGALLIGPVGAILGHVALSQIKKAPQQQLGRGMALTGVIVGWALFGLWLLFIALIAIGAVTSSFETH
ncbi:DUF4190 domain-containing protein [Saccharopolyspora griseoalba]|uniref:DUF4190 domain-containing protein n=1 Tax=Saccharopolyspora griseoalba TaxID=1431848 RepID=A0ABW2LIG4_9PSEU